MLAGALLLSVAVGNTAAEPEVCVADEMVPCGTVLREDADANMNVAVPDAAAAPADVAPVDEAAAAPVELAPAPPVGAVDKPEVTTRTVRAPTVVQPFANPASAPAAAQADVPLPLKVPADQQKLPPGPPTRLP